MDGNSSTSTSQIGLVKELMSLNVDNVYDLALQHDAARVIQAAIQFNTMKDRLCILNELCNGGSNKSTSSTSGTSSSSTTTMSTTTSNNDDTTNQKKKNQQQNL